MTILAIESSCDETSASVLLKSGDQVIVKSNITATSLELHSATGGIIPENAARMQVKYIIPVIVKSILAAFDEKETDTLNDWKKSSQLIKENIDAIAVTYGPGLIGSLLVGVETAKTFAFAFNKPIIPVNHLLAHIYANFIKSKLNPKSLNLHPNSFPFIGFIVSGGHTDLLFFNSHKNYKWLGGTRDDAAGEAMDKIGRLLGIPYPAGPEIERRANLAKEKKLRFKSPLMGSDDYDFSFSGLKTEVLRFVKENPSPSEEIKNEICFATQKAIVDVLVKKTLKATDEFNCKKVLVGGGVSANQNFKAKMTESTNLNVYFPDKQYSTDNAAMIGAYALLAGETKPWREINANPELYFD